MKGANAMGENVIALCIEDQGAFVSLLRGLKMIGMLKDVPNTITLTKDNAKFPIRIEISTDKIIDLINNPLVKSKFGKDIDRVLTEQTLKILG